MGRWIGVIVSNFEDLWVLSTGFLQIHLKSAEMSLGMPLRHRDAEKRHKALDRSFSEQIQGWGSLESEVISLRRVESFMFVKPSFS